MVFDQLWLVLEVSLPAQSIWWVKETCLRNPHQLFFFSQAKWLQTLLLNGRNPATNATVIPPSVFPKLAEAVVVQSAVPYVFFLMEYRIQKS